MSTTLLTFTSLGLPSRVKLLPACGPVSYKLLFSTGYVKFFKQQGLFIVITERSNNLINVFRPLAVSRVFARHTNPTTTLVLVQAYSTLRLVRSFPLLHLKNGCSSFKIDIHFFVKNELANLLLTNSRLGCHWARAHLWCWILVFLTAVVLASRRGNACYNLLRS